MSALRRPAVRRMTAAAPSPRASAVRDEGVLELDVELDRADRPPARRATPPHVDGSIKSAIIRWLNEEL